MPVELIVLLLVGSGVLLRISVRLFFAILTVMGGLWLAGALWPAVATAVGFPQHTLYGFGHDTVAAVGQAVHPPPPTPFPTRTALPAAIGFAAGVFVRATAAAPGVDSGVTVSAGQPLHINASGQAGYGYQGGTCVGYPQTDPDGNRTLVAPPNTVNCGRKAGDPNLTLPSAPVGALIGRISNGPWFLVGSSYSGTANASGRLFLLYNDSDSGDNSGGYTVNISTDV